MRTRTSMIVAALVAAAFVVPAVPAVAVTSDDTGQDTLVVTAPAESEVDEPTTVQELLAETSAETAPRELTDAEVSVLESAGLAQAASNSCNSYKNALAGLAWQTVTDFGCSLIGTKNGSHSYQWAKGTGTPANASVCIQGRGWKYVDANKPWLGVTAYWGSGCGGSGSFVVKWQESAANTQIKHRVFVAPGIGLGFSWR